MAWIRSQNRDILMKVAWLALATTRTRIMAAQEGEEGYTEFGTFPSQETALAELDSIERWIADGAQGVYQVSP